MIFSAKNNKYNYHRKKSQKFQKIISITFQTTDQQQKSNEARESAEKPLYLKRNKIISC